MSSSEVVLSPHFLRNNSKGKGLETTTCLKTVALCIQCHATLKYCHYDKSIFFFSQISLTLQGYHKDDVYLATLNFGDTGSKTVASVSVVVAVIIVLV